MAIVWAIAGLLHWVDGGGTLKKGWEDHMPDFQGSSGFAIHGIVGGMVLPALGIVFMVVAFLAKVDRGVKWAGGVLALIVVQVGAGMAGADAPWLGLLHGLLPFALFSAAIVAARAAHPATQTPVAATP
jgi:hypothetical protein